MAEPKRPEYGEYATPEEQRARMGLPPEGAHAPTPFAPAAERETIANAPALRPAPPAPVPAPGFGLGAAPGGVPPRGDRIISLLLLGAGLFAVITMIPMLIDLSTAVRQAFEQFGIDSFSNTGLASTMGWVILAVNVLLWLGTARLTLGRIRAGKLSWWIPVVAGAIAFIVLMVLLGIVMGSDPAFMEYVQRQGTP